MKSKMIAIKRLGLFFVTVVMATAGLDLAYLPSAHAATAFNNAFVRYDTLVALSQTTGRICFQPSTTTTIRSVQVTFPTNSGTDYVVTATTTNWTFNTSNLDSGQTALTNLPTNPTISGKTITVTLTTDLTTPSTSTTYCFNWVGATTLKLPSVDNPAGGSETVAGTVASRDTTSTIINSDQFSYSRAIISDNSVVVNAVVPPSFTFTLGGNTDTFASNLATGSVNSSPGNTITITTNAFNGWIVWAKDGGSGGTQYKTVTDSNSNPANRHGALLAASAGSYPIANGTTNSISAASHAFSAGTEDYGLAATLTAAGTGAGTTTINTVYNGATAGNAGTPDPTQFRPMASSNGTANSAQLTVKEVVTISGNTPAASDYTDTFYYIGAGQF